MSYRYRALRDNEIRLIEVLPTQDSTDIRITIRHVQITQKPIYEALSYCWDPASAPKKKITCEGSNMDISQNLYAFLVQYSCPNKMRTVWADAISIDQSNILERGRQVQLMGLIYSTAQSVLVWLGDACDGSDEAMGLINVLPDKNWKVYEAVVETKTIPDVHHSKWGNVRKLLSRRYFSRMWIIQEIALSRDCVVLCGSSSTTWERINWAAIQFKRLSQLQRHGADRGTIRSSAMAVELSRISAIHKARREIEDSEPQPALSVLLRHRLAEATEDLDCIYALYGLIPQEFDRLGLLPTYDVSTSALYLQVAIAILQHDRNLDIFSVPKAFGAGLGSRKFPSWVPDWTQHTSVQSLLGLEDPGMVRVPYASDSSSWQPSFDVENQRLGVEGYFIDSIATSVMVEPLNEIQPAFSLSAFQCMIAAARRWKAQDQLSRMLDEVTEATSHKPYVTGDRMLDVACATRCAGIYPEGWSVAEEAFRAHRRTRHVSGFFYHLSYILPVYFLLTCAAKIKDFFRGELGKVRGEPLLKPDLDFMTFDRSIGRRIFKTERGYIGLGPPSAEVGDKVVLCKGGKLPLIFRRAGEAWDLKGDCYIYGMMNAEQWVEGDCHHMWIQ